MSLLSKLKPQKDFKQNEELKKRYDDCIPVAKEILETLGTSEVALGEITSSDEDTYYLPISKQVMDIFETHDIKYVDREFVFQLVLQAFQKVKDIITLSLERSFEKANEKLWNKDFRELRMSDIDKILKGKS